MSQRIDNLIDLQRLSEYTELIKRHILNEIQNSKDTVQEYTTYLQFPNVGKSQIIYIDKTSNRSYRWDDTDLKYYLLNNYFDDIKIIDGCIYLESYNVFTDDLGDILTDELGNYLITEV